MKKYPFDNSAVEFLTAKVKKRIAIIHLNNWKHLNDNSNRKDDCDEV